MGVSKRGMILGSSTYNNPCSIQPFLSKDGSRFDRLENLEVSKLLQPPAMEDPWIILVEDTFPENQWLEQDGPLPSINGVMLLLEPFIRVITLFTTGCGAHLED